MGICFSKKHSDYNVSSNKKQKKNRNYGISSFGHKSHGGSIDSGDCGGGFWGGGSSGDCGGGGGGYCGGGGGGGGCGGGDD